MERRTVHRKFSWRARTLVTPSRSIFITTYNNSHLLAMCLQGVWRYVWANRTISFWIFSSILSAIRSVLCIHTGVYMFLIFGQGKKPLQRRLFPYTSTTYTYLSLNCSANVYFGAFLPSEGGSRSMRGRSKNKSRLSRGS